MTNIDDSKIYIIYAKQIVNYEIPAGEYIIKACQRFLDWFSRDDIFFNYESVDKKIRLVGKLKLQEGNYFDLLPFQQWIFANLYGWHYVDDPTTRVISSALILTARKQGKSVPFTGNLSYSFRW